MYGDNRKDHHFDSGYGEAPHNMYGDNRQDHHFDSGYGEAPHNTYAYMAPEQPRDDDEVEPAVRRLDQDAFRLSPWCTLHKGQDHEKRNGTLPCAIEVLANDQWKAPAPISEDEPIPDQGIANLPMELPEKIRINSREIIDFLARTRFDIPPWSLGKGSVLLSLPYRALTEEEQRMRKLYKQLEYNALSAKKARSENTYPQHAGIDPTGSGIGDNRRSPIDETAQGWNVTSSNQPGNQVNAGPSKEELAFAQFRTLVEFYDTSIRPVVDAYTKTSPPKIRFQNLWFLFQPGDELICTENAQPETEASEPSLRHKLLETGEMSVWRVIYVYPYLSRFRGFQSPSFYVRGLRIQHNGTTYQPLSRLLEIPHFEGEKEIASLPVKPLRYHKDQATIRQLLLDNGRRYQQLIATSPSYWTRQSNQASHCGHSNGNQDLPVVVTAEDGIIVDPQFMREAGIVRPSLVHDDLERELALSTEPNDPPRDPCSYDAYGSEEEIRLLVRSLSSDPFLQDCARAPHISNAAKGLLSDRDAILLPIDILAFTPSSGRWDTPNIHQLTPVIEHDALWSRLTLVEGQKEVILARALSHCKRTEDSTQTLRMPGRPKRTQGLTILLYGPSGQGKRSTARGLSLKLKRPLYHISGSIFDSDPNEFSQQLLRRLGRAQRWKAILLISEADELMQLSHQIDCKYHWLYSLQEYGILTIMTANDIDMIPTSLRSIFDLAVIFPRLGKSQFAEIFHSKIAEICESYRGELCMDDTEMSLFVQEVLDSRDFRWTGRRIDDMLRTAITAVEHEAEGEKCFPLRLTAHHLRLFLRATLGIEKSIMDASYTSSVSDAVIAPTGAEIPPSHHTRLQSLGQSLFYSSAISPAGAPALSKKTGEMDGDPVRENVPLQKGSARRYEAMGPAALGDTAPDSDDAQDSELNEEMVAETARHLCGESSLQALLVKLHACTSTNRQFVEDLSRFLEVLGLDLVDEFCDWASRDLFQPFDGEARRLAHGIMVRITCMDISETHEESDENGPGSNPQSASYTVLFESDSFTVFKEGLERYVNSKRSYPYPAPSVDSFLYQGITVERPDEGKSSYSPTGFRAVTRLLQELGLLAKPVKAGQQRVTWRCRCGKTIHDDFSDAMSPGAMHDLILHIRRLGSDCGGDGSSGSGPFVGRLLRETFGAFVTAAKRLLFLEKCLPFVEDRSSSRGDAVYGQRRVPDALYLLICMKSGRFSSSLHQEAIEDLSSDRELFQRLQETYQASRQIVRSWTSLQLIEHVEFVTFNLISGNFVDVRHHERHCTDQVCACLPPPSKVLPAPTAEYKYEPVPPNKSPPVGPNTMMHFVQHPECVADRQKWILRQLPKKLRGKLVARLEAPVVGWGIYFREGRDKKKILWVIVVNLLLIFLFGIMWTALKQDIQGGFGVVSCWVSVVAILLGYMDINGI